MNVLSNQNYANNQINVLTTLFIILQRRMKNTTPELHDVTTLPDPDVQIIEEKSSSSTLLTSMGLSDASIKNSTSHDCITELEHIIATQEADAKKAKDEFEKNLMLTILVQKQEMIQLKTNNKKRSRVSTMIIK